MLSNQLLPYLYYFCAVAKYKSFSKAARILDVTKANISYQIKILEEKLNVMLLVRGSGQRPELTEIGEEIADEFSDIFSYIDRTFRIHEDEMEESIIYISSPLSFGTHLLMHCIDNLQKKTPSFTYNLQLSDNWYTSNEDANMDLFISNTIENSNFYVEPLVNVRYLAAASKSYLDKMPPLETPADLVNHKIIGSYKNCPYWAKFKEHFPETIFPSNEKIFTFGNNQAQLYAVVEGIGVAIFPDYFLLDQDLEKLNVELVLPEYFNNPKEYSVSTLYVSYHKLNIHRTQIEFLVKFLKEYLAEQGKCVL